MPISESSAKDLGGILMVNIYQNGAGVEAALETF